MISNFIYSEESEVFYNKRLIDSVWIEIDKEDSRIYVNFSLFGSRLTHHLSSFGCDRYDDAINYIEQNFVYG